MQPQEHATVFEIDPKKYGKSGAYLGCLVAWALCLVTMALVCAYNGIWFGFYFSAGLVLVGTTLALFQGTKRQRIVAGDDLCIFENDQKEPALRIAKSALIEITNEHVSLNDDAESVTTLNLWSTTKDGKGRYILALGADDKAKNKLKSDLAEFLVHNGFNVVPITPSH